MIRITKSVITGNLAGAKPIQNIFGFCNEEDIEQHKLPTENIGNGSILVDTDNWKGWGFNESTQEWGLTPMAVVINPAAGVSF